MEAIEPSRKFFDKELLCPNCGTIYLRIPEDARINTPIHCSTCNLFLGTWGSLLASFDKQGGQNGVFELRDGQIERKDG